MGLNHWAARGRSRSRHGRATAGARRDRRRADSSWWRASAASLALGLVGLILWPLLTLSSASEPPSRGTALGADGGTIPSNLPLPAPRTSQLPATRSQGPAGPLLLVGTADNPFPLSFLSGSSAGTGAAVGPSGTAAGSTNASGPASASPTGVVGIPSIVLQAYERAATTIAGTDPSCHLSWEVLAGIGKIESDHAGNGQVTADGTASPPILGPVLDGSGGNAAIPDTDQGRWDGDTTWDRAVGPMQFIPSTWVTWAATDRTGVSVPDPENVFDASLAAGHYLCASGGDLSTQSGLDAAILSYNHSSAYVSAVEAWITSYATAGSAPSSSNSTVPVSGSGSSSAASSRNGGGAISPQSPTTKAASTSSSSPAGVNPTNGTNPPKTTAPSPSPTTPGTLSPTPTPTPPPPATKQPPAPTSTPPPSTPASQPPATTASLGTLSPTTTTSTPGSTPSSSGLGASPAAAPSTETAGPTDTPTPTSTTTP